MGGDICCRTVPTTLPTVLKPRRLWGPEWAAASQGRSAHTPRREEEEGLASLMGEAWAPEATPARSGEQPRDHQGLGVRVSSSRCRYHVLLGDDPQEAPATDHVMLMTAGTRGGSYHHDTEGEKELKT